MKATKNGSVLDQFTAKLKSMILGFPAVYIVLIYLFLNITLHHGMQPNTRFYTYR